MAINNIPGVGPTNADIATAVAAPSASTIATAVAAAVPTASAITTIVQSNAGATLAQHQEYSAGNWAWLGRTSFVNGTSDYTITGLSDYRKIRVFVGLQRSSGLDVFLRLNGATSNYFTGYIVEVPSTSNVTGQVVANWSIMRTVDVKADVPGLALIDIESPPGGQTLVRVETMTPGGASFSTGTQRGQGINLYNSTDDISNITILASSSGMYTDSIYGISVWGMK